MWCYEHIVSQMTMLYTARYITLADRKSSVALWEHRALWEVESYPRRPWGRRSQDDIYGAPGDGGEMIGRGSGPVWQPGAELW